MLSIERIVDEKNIHDEAIFYRLYDEAELVRWKMTDCAWDQIDKSQVSPSWVAVARETLIGELTTFSATERFFTDFGDDVDFTQWLTVWLYEETKHPSAILKWLDARIEPPERYAAKDPFLDHRMDSRPRFDRKLQRELVEEAVVDQPQAGDRRQPLRCLACARVIHSVSYTHLTLPTILRV